MNSAAHGSEQPDACAAVDAAHASAQVCSRNCRELLRNSRHCTDICMHHIGTDACWRSPLVLVSASVPPGIRIRLP